MILLYIASVAVLLIFLLICVMLSAYMAIEVAPDYDDF